MGLSDVMRKAAGLLVEMPDEPPPIRPTPGSATAGKPAPDVDALLSAAGVKKTVVGEKTSRTATELAGPGLEKIRGGAAEAAQPSAATAKVDVAAVFKAAGVQAVPFNAEQALELIRAMPAELPIAVRRQTVHATMTTMGKTLGASVETVVADATRKVTALDGYQESFKRKTEEFVAKADTDIAALEEQIEQRRKSILAARQRVEELARFCDAEADKLDEVLEFFSLDSGTSQMSPQQNSKEPQTP